ncbi:di-trans,poly-cis-decaprenylcistransferase [bacterium]|nr:di-trans,poly-cis-decaprenylcistransferase [bacterium]
MTDEERNSLKENLVEEVLNSGVPEHVAMIMDGNGRWAKDRGFTRIRGHQAGARNVKRLVQLADDLGIRHITLYAFSIENWARPWLEVSALMRLILAYIIRERNELHKKGVRFRFLGRISELSPRIIEEAQRSTELMAKNTGITLNLCINYGGRSEIVDAIKKIIIVGIPPEKITEEIISQYLYVPDLPDPDLIIRTSGEMRISNFLLWQCAYSELVISAKYWPDFDEIEFLKSLRVFQLRERRFGKTSEQIISSEG